MAQMTDPALAMESFQEALQQGYIRLERGRLDRDLHMYSDTEIGVRRFVYVRLDGQAVSSYVCFARCADLEGTICLAVGYAVPETYRNQGRAAEVLRAGIAELQSGFAGHPPFYVEAIVGMDNLASQHVAAKILAAEPKAVTDQVSGLPALQYLRRVDTGTSR